MSENDLELLYQRTLNIDIFVTHVVASVCLFLLCMDFIECGHSGNKRWRTALIGSVYFFVYAGFYFIIDGFSSFWSSIPALFAAFIVSVWIDRKNIRTKIFLFSTFLVMRWMAVSIANTLSYFLLEPVDHLIGRLEGYAELTVKIYYYLSFCASCFLDVLLCWAILYGMVRVLRNVFVYKREDMELWELLTLLIPPVNGIIVYSLFRLYADIYESETQFSIYQQHRYFELLETLCQAVILAAIIGTIVLYQKTKKKQEEENIRRMLESEIKDVQSHIAEVEKLYTDIRGVKHDINNHITVISSLLAQGKADEASGYAKLLSETVKTFDFSVRMGNPVTDIIIHEKKRAALEYGIEFISEFHYPTGSDINAFDISVILSNALSNAIEAAQASGTEGWIRLSSFRNKNAYLIKVENSFVGSLDIDGDSGMPRTKKSNKNAHGIGFGNMKSIAEKYYGDVSIEQKESRVILTIMLLTDGWKE